MIVLRRRCCRRRVVVRRGCVFAIEDGRFLCFVPLIDPPSPTLRLPLVLPLHLQRLLFRILLFLFSSFLDCDLEREL